MGGRKADIGARRKRVDTGSSRRQAESGPKPVDRTTGAPTHPVPVVRDIGHEI
jgi:hypothetical protein